jgi:hypothetical protein
MKLLPDNNTDKRFVDSLIWLISSVPALCIGVGSTFLLLSYWAGEPVGPAELYQRELIQAEEPNSRGRVMADNRAEHIVPSPILLVFVAVGMCCGGLGIHLSHRRWPGQRISAPAAGMIACAIALFLAWTLHVWAAPR